MYKHDVNTLHASYKDMVLKMMGNKQDVNTQVRQPAYHCGKFIELDIYTIINKKIIINDQ